MLLPRVIPCLLLNSRGLCKTVGFGSPKYVGDPINAVRIFNEKEVDELMVLDIDATAEGREPDYSLIQHLAAECRMPLCYGGGIKTGSQIERIIALGVEKVALSSVLSERPEIVIEASASVGSQSIVAVLDVRRASDGTYAVFTHNGTRPTERSPQELAKSLQQLGIGEIVVNSIDNDGNMKGYDLALIDLMRKEVHVPMTCLGGAGSLADMQAVVARHGAIGVAAGSLFVFKGVYRAVLINYPDPKTKSALFDLVVRS
jgi:imidazole glycerol-phosphate synthase subunit HisF